MAEKYEENEKILAIHQGMMWEAKVVKADTNGTPVLYLVHYQGWNKKHDEWLQPERLFKYNEVNLAKQRAMQSTGAGIQATAAAEKKKKKYSGDKASPAGPSPMQKPKSQKATGKRKADDDHDDPRKPEIKLDIPSVLKTHLLEDSEWVSKKKLVPLPRNPSVAQVLEKYLATINTPSSQPGTVSGAEYNDDIANGLRAYFDEALGAILLYKFERAQYAQTRTASAGKPLSEIYGPEHLLRLFVKLPEMIARTTMDEESIRMITTFCDGLLDFMAQHASTLFLSDYETAAADYNK